MRPQLALEHTVDAVSVEIFVLKTVIRAKGSRSSGVYYLIEITMPNPLTQKIKENDIKSKIFNIVAKLDNGSHSSNQLQGIDEYLIDLYHSSTLDLLDTIDRWCEKEKTVFGGKETEGGILWGWEGIDGFNSALASVQNFIREAKKEL